MEIFNKSIMPLIKEAKLKEALQYTNQLTAFSDEFEKLKFLQNLNENLIFQTYKQSLAFAGE
jgi:hypothetical protein